jgi:arylsulfatase A-like enzyme
VPATVSPALTERAANPTPDRDDDMTTTLRAALLASLVGCGAEAAPPTREVRVVPAQFGLQTTLECLQSPALDGEETRTRWLRDGEIAGTGARLSGPHRAGEVLTCEVAVRAGGKVVQVLRDSVTVPAGPRGQNIVLLILDDLGVERIASYGVEQLAPPTPVLDRMAGQGVLFERAYANPVCSPTRVGMLTGTHAQNNGIGTAITVTGPGLPFSAWTLPEALDELTDGAYSHAAVGKWHISGLDRGPDNPVEHGFDRFAGTISNLSDSQEGGYTDWLRLEHGRHERVHTYATTDTVNTALGFMKELPEPFFLWVGFHAAHVPFHIPPAALSGVELEKGASVPERYNAAITAVDTEIGRLLASMPEELRQRTTFLVIGDNGTPQFAAEAPYDHDRVKTTVFEGGVRVPLIVMGPTVGAPGRRSDALISHVDLFPTILDLAGASLAPARAARLDGISFASHLASAHAPQERRYAYSEIFTPIGREVDEREHWDRALTDRRWKYIRRLNGREELYDLQAFHLDDHDLIAAGPLDPEAQEALDRLQRVMQLDFAPREPPGWW